MSTFGDYKSYKKYEPAYAVWKNNRDTAETKRLVYLKQNPSEISNEDIQRGQTLIRAIDIMDEYSQKRAEDTEVATEAAMGMALELLMIGGAGLGYLAGQLKPIKNLINKLGKNSKQTAKLNSIIPVIAGGLLGTIASFPLQAWGAKAEVSASRKGRFEAMRKELNNPNSFAILNDEQIRKAQEISKNIALEEDNTKNKIKSAFLSGTGLESLKSLASDSKDYKKQRQLFELELQRDKEHLNDKMTPDEIEKAKKDQQLLTKLVEKIDIASQDYAENAELTAGAIFTGVLGFSALGNLLIEKLLNACKVKSAPKIALTTKILGAVASMGSAIFMAQISKNASRVGRFKVKQELMKHPESFVYVDDEKANSIKDFNIDNKKKDGIFEFIKNVYKDNKDYQNYKKTKANEEKRFYKAVEKLELDEQQVKDAKRLQKNAFRTFNKVDDNSQKYSESVEALGQASVFPINLIFSGLGAIIGLKFLNRKPANKIQEAENFIKYFGVILASSLPSILINAHITKEQKKASRVADMLAINEMQDYRNFR